MSYRQCDHDVQQDEEFMNELVVELEEAGLDDIILRIAFELTML